MSASLVQENAMGVFERRCVQNMVSCQPPGLES